MSDDSSLLPFPFFRRLVIFFPPLSLERQKRTLKEGTRQKKTPGVSRSDIKKTPERYKYDRFHSFVVERV